MDHSAQKGFTLIELMVSLVVLVVIATSSIVGVITFNQNQGIADDAKQVVSEVRRVYSRATGILYPTNCVAKVTGYRMVFADGSNDIVVTALGCNVSETRTDVLKTSHFTGADNFVVDVKDGRIAGSPITITITSDANSSLTESIVVSDFGVTEIL